jgi:hypothetical protein
MHAIRKPRPGLLLELLLSDAATDVEVVTRELDLINEMFERLRRALDRVACAQSLLASMRSGGRGDERRRDGGMRRGREATDLDVTVGDTGRGGMAGKGVAGRVTGWGGEGVP